MLQAGYLIGWSQELSASVINLIYAQGAPSLGLQGSITDESQFQ